MTRVEPSGVLEVEGLPGVTIQATSLFVSPGAGHRPCASSLGITSVAPKYVGTPQKRPL
jgi:hypothetical protein